MTKSQMGEAESAQDSSGAAIEPNAAEIKISAKKCKGDTPKKVAEVSIFKSQEFPEASSPSSEIC